MYTQLLLSLFYTINLKQGKQKHLHLFLLHVFCNKYGRNLMERRISIEYFMYF